MLEPGDGIDCLVCSGKYKGDFHRRAGTCEEEAGVTLGLRNVTAGTED